jgi:AraC family transcriptional regulator
LGKIATNVLASGNDWTVADVVCTYGPKDRSFEELHTSISITVVLAGSFQYRSSYGSEILTPGALLLGNLGHYFEIAHDHAIGDRCVGFFYTPEFFERASLAGRFPIHRVPAIRNLSPWIVQARQAIHSPDELDLKELAHDLPAAVIGTLGLSRQFNVPPSAADERRISSTLRFIEGNLEEPLPLERIASIAKMSEFHFLRVFKQVTQMTPHQ